MSHQTIKIFDRDTEPQGLNIDIDGNVGVVLYDQYGDPLVTDDGKVLTKTYLADHFTDEARGVNVDREGHVGVATHGDDRNGDLVPISVTPGGKIITKSSHDDAVDSGEIFFLKDFTRPSGADTEQTFTITIPANPYGSYSEVHLHWAVHAEAEFEMRTYYAPTINAPGTLLTPLNRNANYQGPGGPVPISQWRRDATFTDYGAETYADVVGNGKRNVAGHSFQGEFILNANSLWSMVFKKVATGTHWLSWEFNFSEDLYGAQSSTTTSTTTTEPGPETYSVSSDGDDVVHEGDSVIHTF